MRLSIHGRLTAWYAGAVLAALTVSGLGLYAVVLRLDLARLDEDLRRTASTVAFGIAAEAKEGLDLHGAAADAASELRIPGTALAVYDLKGALLASRWENFEPEAAGDRELREGLVTVPSSAAQWRRLTTRQRYQGTEYFVVNVVPLDQINEDAALVRSSLLTVVPLTVLLAAAGGWLLARSALRPISRLAAEAGQISQEQPDARLSVPERGDELSALARAFNSLLHRLQTAIQSQRQFMADASHELRTPVSVIRSAADVTLDRFDRSIEDYRDSMIVIEEQARRLSRLVDDLFLLARADADGRPLVPCRFYLDDLLSECARAVGVLTSSKGVRFEIVAEEDVEMEADEDLVRRMLVNLLENAARHAPPGTPVHVRMARAGDHVEVSVRDNGSGVPPEDRERIFERFVRLEPVRAGGAGLGLPIARWIAELHGGSLTLEQSSSRGSTFVVRMPA